jgi:nucleotide-binding universal stress UspA family protein
LASGRGDSFTGRVVLMVQALIVAGWIAIGGAVGFYEVRRGHWRWLWLRGAIAGPLAIPLARQANRDEPHAKPVVLGDAPEGPHRPGLSVLVGVDGTHDSGTASSSIVRALGPRLGSLTLATVLDYEAMVDYAAPSGQQDRDRAQAEALLAGVAADLEPVLGRHPATVVLAGKPATALQQHAHEQGCDLIVIGRRGRGVIKPILGSCASELARASSVPVVIMPTCDGSHRGSDR